MIRLQKLHTKIKEYTHHIGSNQKSLAEGIGLHPTTLSDKLAGRQKLLQPEIKAIILTLVKWKALLRQVEVVELLELAGLAPEVFSPQEWRTPPLSVLVRNGSSRLPFEVDTRSDVPNNLPFRSTTFLGRDKEINEICTLLDKPDVRMISLVGTAGAGKTRLALQVANLLLTDFSQGVFLVDLTTIRDPLLIPATIAKVLGVKQARAQSILDSLKSYLFDKELLLVLDNFEHLLAGVGEIAELLKATPGLKILATSRENLHLYGEHEFPVTPLPIPSKPEIGLKEAIKYPAIELFLQRATSARYDFAITAENIKAVAEICIKLDGIPLAIELAAAYARTLSPEAILTRLERRFKFLTNGPRDLPTRQQKLRNAIDWSYDLLTRPEKELFARIAVFVGTCQAEAAEAVCNLYDDLPVEVVEVLDTLCDKCLLIRDEGTTGTTSYRMLETIREYALEQLVKSEEKEEVELKYATYYLQLAQKARQTWRGPEESSWFEIIDKEHDNLCQALEILREKEGVKALELASALWRFWWLRGHLSEGLGRLELALANSNDGPAELKAEALHGAGVLAWAQADYKKAMSYYQSSLAFRKVEGDKKAIARLLGNMGVVALDQADYPTAISLFEESLELGRALEDKMIITFALGNLGSTADAQGDYLQAQALFEETLPYFRELEEEWAVAATLVNIGLLLCRQEKYEEAKEQLDEGFALRQKLEDKQGIADSLRAYGDYYKYQKNFTEAEKFYKLGFQNYLELGDIRDIAQCLEELAEVNIEFKNEKLAVHFYSKASMLRSTGDIPFETAQEESFIENIAYLKNLLGQNSFEVEWATGQKLSIEEIAQTLDI